MNPPEKSQDKEVEQFPGKVIEDAHGTIPDGVEYGERQKPDFVREDEKGWQVLVRLADTRG